MSATASNIMRHVIIAASLCIAIQPSAADTVTLRFAPGGFGSPTGIGLSLAQAPEIHSPSAFPSPPVRKRVVMSGKRTASDLRT